MPEPTYFLDNRTPTQSGVRDQRGRQGMAALVSLLVRGIAAALVLLWCAVPNAFAQEARGIHGTASDSSGAPLYGALILVEDANGTRYTTVSDATGAFRISNLADGKYRIKVSATGFSDWDASDVRPSADPKSEPVAAVLQVAPQVTAVTATLPPEEVAAEQVRQEMKQRTLLVIPNFYVTYEDHPAPLAPKEKFHLALRLLVDPTTIGAAGIAAGIQQAKNSYWEWGQGGEAYGKRFAAAYGTAAHNLIITSVFAASVLHQDPRYFYSGKGTVARRTWYAVASAFRTKGDNGKWQPPYAGLIGTMASAEIAATYYPSSRTQYSLLGRSLMFHFVGLAAVNVAQEFLLHKVTSHTPKPQPALATVLREGTRVRLIAVHGFSAAETHDGGKVDFVLAEELIVNGKVLAKAGDIASGQVSKVSRAQGSARRWTSR